MGETNAWAAAHSLATGGSWVVSIACQIALIVVVATVVRRHRPDAWTALLAWIITSAVTMVVTPVLHTVLTLVIARSAGGIEGIYKSQVIAQAVLVPLHIAVVVLLVRGLVRIAQPPPKVEVGPTPPYR